jgi:hypothetical protein
MIANGCPVQMRNRSDQQLNQFKFCAGYRGGRKGVSEASALDLEVGIARLDHARLSKGVVGVNVIGMQHTGAARFDSSAAESNVGWARFGGVGVDDGENELAIVQGSRSGK